MALFGNLFKKKECAICGGEIGLLGNRKLEDGNMCKKCAAKLSPFFDDRRHSTVEQIKQQLEYREANAKELAGFNPTRSIGNNDKFMYEERAGVPYRFVVSDAKEWRKENPDIILFKDLTACEFEVQHYDRELTYKDEQGEEQSYFPKRYEYNYDFFAELTIANNPYFDKVVVKLNRNTVEIVSEKINSGLFGGRSNDHTYHPEYRIHQQMFEDIKEVVNRSKGIGAVGAGSDPIMALIEKIRTAPDFETVVETNKTVTALVNDLPNRDAYFVLQTQAMKEAQARIQAEMTAATVAAAPASAAGTKFCPNCGAPASGKFCENCGTRLM